jgi:hypothetical protein
MILLSARLMIQLILSIFQMSIFLVSGHYFQVRAADKGDETAHFSGKE